MKRLYVLLLMCFCAQMSFAQQVEWIHSFDHPSGDVAYAVEVDADGSVYTAGKFGGIMDFDPGIDDHTLSASGASAFIQKFNSLGEFEWATQMTGTSAEIQGLVVDGDALYAVGLTIDQSIIVKKDISDGSTIWQFYLSPGINRANGITCDADGNIYIAGNFEGSVDFDPGMGVHTLDAGTEADMFILKLDSDGNFLWARHFEGTEGDWAGKIALDNAGSIYLSGAFGGLTDFDPGLGTEEYSSAGLADIFLLKLDSDGNFLWVNVFGGAGYDYSHGLDIDLVGDVYVTMAFTGTIDFDPGAADHSLTAASSQADLAIVKYDGSGGFEWLYPLSTTGREIGFSLKVLNSRVYVVGRFGGDLDLVSGQDSYLLDGDPLGAGFLVELGTDGQLLYAGSVNSSSTDVIYDVAISGSEKYLVGTYKSDLDLDQYFDPANSFSSLDHFGGEDYFIMKFSGHVGLEELSSGSDLGLYPNPTNSHLMIENEHQNSIDLFIYDLAGVLVHQTQSSDQIIELDVSNLSSGMYVVKYLNTQTKTLQTAQFIKNE